MYRCTLFPSALPSHSILPHPLTQSVCLVLIFEDHEGTVSIEGRTITSLRFADDIDGFSSHLSLNREGRWGTTDDFATSTLHFYLFSTAL